MGHSVYKKYTTFVKIYGMYDPAEVVIFRKKLIFAYLILKKPVINNNKHLILMQYRVTFEQMLC